MTTHIRLDEAILPENQATLNTYYSSVERGEFLQILDTLSDNIEYVITGNTALLPFSGVWSGKARVAELFKIFGSAFQLLDLRENVVLRSADRVISANDESFMVWKTGRYYRVPVLHVVEFDSNNRIRRFINIHDTSTAEQAFSGADTGLVAIMPKDEPKAPARRLTEEAAMELANGIVSVIFGDCAATALKRFPHLCLYVPGLPSVAAISGVWTGPGLSTNYPAQAERFREKYGIAATQVLIDDVTVSEGKLAIEGRLRDQRWAIVGSIHEVGLGATALFIDFPAL